MLNEPRAIPYSFKTFELDGILWLFDDSERQFPCTATAHIYAEPLYYTEYTDGDEHDLPEGGLFAASSIGDSEFVDMEEADCAFGNPREYAWDAARDASL